MDRLEVHSLICKRDINLLIATIKLFHYHSKLDFDIVIHEDGSFDNNDVEYLVETLPGCTIIRKEQADEQVKNFLKDYELCTHFRFAEHHTIFRIKLFDPFYFTKTHNIINTDADILFCNTPHVLLEHIKNKEGVYLRDTWSSYCVPFRDEDENTLVDRYINAGFNYYPTKNYYSLEHIEKCLEILYNHGSRGATHPFLEQSCVAYMITQLKKENIKIHELPTPDYCIPTFGDFIPNHKSTLLHLNSSPLVGKWKHEHYEHELNKANINFKYHN
jgi:lipopolysaccharide biosynthesis glycosyltransferase